MTDHVGLDWVLLSDHLAGGASAETTAAVERWIGDDAERIALVQRFQQVWDQRARASASQFDRALMESNIFNKIAAQSTTSANQHNRLRSGRSSPRWTPRSVAGVASIIAGLAVIVAMVSRGHVFDSSHVTGSTRTYATVAGQIVTVVLQDGSRVTLGPATTLRVSNGGTREGTVATVAGEALFAITHRSDAPFLVRIGSAETRVLGTVFDVRHYENEAYARVVVTEGRVAVHGRHANAASAAVLGARMLAQVDDSGNVRIVPNVTLDDYTGWAAGKLSFHSTPLRDVIADLARTYGADIRVTDSVLAKQPITLSASISSDPLPAVMDFLARAADAHWVRVNDTFTLVPGRAVSISSPPHFPSPEIHYGR